MWCSGSAPLFLQAGPVGQASAELPLWMLGSSVGTSGAHRSMELYLYSDESGNVLERGMVLSLLGASQGETTRNLNLFVEGRYHATEGSCQLYLHNEGTTGAIPLFIEGSGVTEGSVPYSTTMNLFLRRTPAGAAPLYLHGPGEPESSGMSLFLHGHINTNDIPLINRTVSLSIPGTIGEVELGMPLYTHGF